MLREMDDARLARGRDAVVLSPRPRRIGQRVDAALDIALFPARDEAISHGEGAAGRGVGGAVGEQEDTAHPASDPCRRGRGAHQMLEIRPLSGGERESHRGSKHAHRRCKTDAINILDMIH